MQIIIAQDEIEYLKNGSSMFFILKNIANYNRKSCGFKGAEAPFLLNPDFHGKGGQR
jgi:hypothetical protein